MDEGNGSVMFEEWMSDAACAETGSEFFFPEPSEYPYDAKKICGGCPVVAQCLGYVLTLPAGTPGVWGGLSYTERAQLRATVA